MRYLGTLLTAFFGDAAPVEEMKMGDSMTKLEAADPFDKEMNDWREEWYGVPSPAGGVPAE